MELNWNEISSQGELQVAEFRGEQSSRPGELIVKELSPANRVGRGIGVFFIGLFITAFSALIPIVHFLLTPIFLVISFIVAYFVSAAKKVILGGRGECPGCGAPVQIFRRKFSSKFMDHCEKCGRQFEVSTK